MTHDPPDSAGVTGRQRQQASRRATEVAAELASTFDAQLAILHVAPPVQYRVGRLAPTRPITRRLDDPLSSPVLPDARRVASAHGANANVILIAGDPAPVIVTIASQLGADLLVIGTTRRLLPAPLVARTRWWVHAHTPWPVLPVTTDRPAVTPPAAEPVLVT